MLRVIGEALPGPGADLALGDLRPMVAARIPLPEAAHAHELLEHGRHAGKVVLMVPG